MSAGLRSGQVAEAAGVNVQTLRYYERRGLLAEPTRSNGGHRLYGEDAVTALRVIKAAQRLGFTLEEVAELLEAGRHRHGRPVAGLQERAAAKLAEVGGVGAGAVAGPLPAVAVVLAVLAAGTWWYGRRDRPCSCGPKTTGGGGCGCTRFGDPVQISGTGRSWGLRYDHRAFRCPVRRRGALRDRRCLAGLAGRPRTQGLDLDRRRRHRARPVRGGGHLPVR
ncbi:MerR family transcriptional regulator [Streptomyces erythrochromogenes]|uniref:MerR family transcriptional regulator n=1 Tax=Streptomyces erythrochromogenes TaxID=285574 RepID=UPI0037D4F773